MFEVILRIKDKAITKGLELSLSWQIKFMQDQVTWAKAQITETVRLSDGSEKDRLQWIAESEAEIVLHQQALADIQK